MKVNWRAKCRSDRVRSTFWVTRAPLKDHGTINWRGYFEIQISLHWIEIIWTIETNFICLSFLLVCSVGGWDRCIYPLRMDADRFIISAVAYSREKWCLHRFAGIRWRGHARYYHCFLGMLRRIKGIAMHAGLGKLPFDTIHNVAQSHPWYCTLNAWILSIHGITWHSKFAFFSSFVQFFCFLLVVLVAEIATGVYAYLNQDQLLKMVRTSVKHSIQNEYSVNKLQTETFDAFQKHVSDFDSTLWLSFFSKWEPLAFQIP